VPHTIVAVAGPRGEELVGGTGHYLNFEHDVAADVLHLIKAYHEVLQGARPGSQPVSFLGPISET
jgi:hypothetical protein